MEILNFSLGFSQVTSGASLNASSDDLADFSELHLGDLGVPRSGSDNQIFILSNRDYVVGFSAKRASPAWVAFQLSSSVTGRFSMQVK